MRIIPELLSPAGSMEKLKVAIQYGADAVYVGGQKYGLRSAADNFTESELKRAVKFAHSYDSKVFVVLNAFLHNEDFDGLVDYIKFLEEIHIDAVIVSDPGVFSTVKKNSSIPVHVSTQASCLNSDNAKMWKKLGAERIVLGREVSIDEASLIKKLADVEVELFIHGSMCMAYSGNCVISNYTQGRDSNRGGCAHSCRFEYSEEKENDQQRLKSFFMSSKDLQGIRALENFIEQGIDSLKIEGRMKGPLYAGTVTKVYRQALDFYQAHGHFLSEQLYQWEEELGKIVHRSYTDGSLINDAGIDSVFNEREVDSAGVYKSIGSVIETSEKDIFIEVKNAFYPDTTLEILGFDNSVRSFIPKYLIDLSGEHVEKTKPSTIIRVPFMEGVQRDNLVRARL